MRRTKIVCTIGPASREPEVLRQLIRSGMDVARLNFSHGDPQTHGENVKRIRATAEAEGRLVAILVDLQGPKFRMGSITSSGILVNEGDKITLTTEDIVGQSAEAIPVQNERLVTLLEPGNQVFIDDGLIELSVTKISNSAIECRVIVGGTIKSNKGMNLPAVSAELPSLTDKDRNNLSYALDWGVDWIALSFVRSAKDIIALKKSINEHSNQPPAVMAKIEKPEALDNIDEIIEISDGIMVARGDLGIEIPAERVPMTQKWIIERCNEMGVPVVTATQMLDSMIRNPRPTRAEASDVANALIDGTDAVMLSGETAVGHYPTETLETMVRIIQEVEGNQRIIPVPSFRSLTESSNLSIARSVARAAREAAHNLGAAAIIAITSSGYTARIVSRYRPNVPIFAITPDERVQRQLKLHWGVTPLLAPSAENTDKMINNALQIVKAHGLLAQNELVVITAGKAGSEPGTTNLLQIEVIEDI